MRLSRILVAGLALAALSPSLLPALQAGPEPTPRAPEVKKSEEIEKAEKAFTSGQFEETLKFLQAAEKKDPNLPPARLTLARYFLMAAPNAQESQRGQLFQLARLNLEKASAESPEHPDIYLQLANIAINEGRLTETILACQIAQQLSRDRRWTAEQRKTFERESYAGLSAAFERRGDWESAKNSLTQWKLLDPKSAPVMQTLAKVLFNLGNPDGAYMELLGAAKEDTTLDMPEITMGQLWSARPDKAEKAKAEDWFMKAIKKDAKSAKAQQAYANWLLETGNIPVAKLQIDEAKKIEGTSPSIETRFLMGLLARYERKYPEAEKLFEELSRDQPANFAVSNQLALVLASVTNPNAATLQKAQQIATVNRDRLSRNAEAWSTLGWVTFKMGKTEEAEKFLNVAISSGSLSPDTAYFIAVLLEKKGAGLVKQEEKESNADGIRKFLEPSIASQAAFVFRPEAETLLANTNKAFPKKEVKKDEPKKDEPKKDEPKK